MNGQPAKLVGHAKLVGQKKRFFFSPAALFKILRKPKKQKKYSIYEPLLWPAQQPKNPCGWCGSLKGKCRFTITNKLQARCINTCGPKTKKSKLPFAKKT